MPNLSKAELRAWRGFLDTHDNIVRRLDADLADHGLNLASYDLLFKLQEAGQTGVRMTKLARSLRFSGGGLTRLVDRLEAQGFIERRRCADDGRGFEVVLTRSGATKLKRIHVKHLGAIRANFLAHLSTVEIATLTTIWNRFEPEEPQGGS